MIFFEAPHRLCDFLADAVDAFGADRPACVARELTKTYEQVRRGPLAELAEWAADGVRGEITVVVGGAVRGVTSVADAVASVLSRVGDGERLPAAVAEVAAEAGLPKRVVYDAAVAARKDGGLS